MNSRMRRVMIWALEEGWLIREREERRERQVRRRGEKRLKISSMPWELSHTGVFS